MSSNILYEKPFFLDQDDVKWVMDTLDAMSLDEKIEQLFCAEIRAGETEKIEKITAQHKVGAVMCLPSEKRELYDLITDLQKKSRIPLLMGGNFEEGADAIKDATNIGNNLQIASTDNPFYAEQLGEITAKEGTAIGFNWAFAPVIDIGMNWRNPVIATRVYGNNAEQVSKFAVKQIVAMQQNGMAATMKHFPGDGVDERDQHFSPTINSLSCEEWDNTFGKVYRDCIDAGALSVMVGHILQPAWQKAINPSLSDEDLLPASTSKELLGGLLRSGLGFNGVISTDSTTMTGFAQLLPRSQAIPMAIAAGCDMILFTKNLDEDIEYLKTGYKKEIVSVDRLNEAVMRILGMKAALKLHTKKEDNDLQKPFTEAAKIVGDSSFGEIERQCAKDSITLVKNKEDIFPINPEKTKRIYMYAYAEGRGFGNNVADLSAYLKKKLDARGFEVTCSCDEPIASDAGYDDTVAKYDLILYALNLNSISQNTVCRMNWSPTMGEDAPNYICDIPTAVVSFGNPYMLVDLPRVKTYINAYKFKESTVDALIDCMLGKAEFKGTDPVDPFCGFYDTRL